MMDNIKDRFSAAEMSALLEVFKAEIHFPNLTPPSHIQEILDFVSDRTKLRTLSSIDLAENAVMLSCYSIYLLSQENRCRSYSDWCESNIKYIVGQKIREVSGYGFQEKDIQIRSNDDTACGLEKMKLIAQTKLNTIYLLSHKIQFLVKSIEQLCYEKGRNRT
jgi:hypothetical protein